MEMKHVVRRSANIEPADRKKKRVTNKKAHLVLNARRSGALTDLMKRSQIKPLANSARERVGGASRKISAGWSCPGICKMM